MGKWNIVLQLSILRWGILRDTFKMLHNKGIAVEQKPIFVGGRVEHPAEIINLIRYGDKYKNFPGIGPLIILSPTPIENRAGCVYLLHVSRW